MALPFEGILLVSDLDGTLIGDQFQIPKRNLEALERFKAQGGLFTIATGRATDSAARYVQQALPNAPCIIFNGSMIYHYAEQKILWTHPLPSSSGDYIKRIMERFPEVGVEICTDQMIHVLRKSRQVEAHLFHERIRHRSCQMDEVEGQWQKAFFALDQTLLPELKRFVETFSHDDVRFVQSSKVYFEMLPLNVDKGIALKKLAEHLGILKKNIYAIGDYYNDLELFAAAGTSIAPQNALADLQQKADFVVCHCNEGAIADAIAMIEKNRGK